MTDSDEEQDNEQPGDAQPTPDDHENPVENNSADEPVAEPEKVVEEPEKEPESEPAAEPETKEQPAEVEQAEAPVEPSAEKTEEKQTVEKAKEAVVEKAEEKPKAEPPKKKKEKVKEKAKEPEDDEVDEDFNYIVRIVNSDLDGYKTVEMGLTGITGIGSRLAVIITDASGISRTKKLGKLTEEEISILEDKVKNLIDLMPSWLLNRRKDIITGDDIHIFGPEIELTLRDDQNRLRMIRCYRGIRHEQGQKVRGQRTRANGRSGTTVGVVKKALRQQKTGGGDKKKK